MKRAYFFFLLILSLVLSCSSSSTKGKSETGSDTTKTEKSNEKTSASDYQKLIVGSWFNYAAASGENVAFKADGTFDYAAGNINTSGTWKIEGDYLWFFDVKSKIVKLDSKVLIIKDDLGATTYERME